MSRRFTSRLIGAVMIAILPAVGLHALKLPAPEMLQDITFAPHRSLNFPGTLLQQAVLLILMPELLWQLSMARRETRSR